MEPMGQRMGTSTDGAGGQRNSGRSGRKATDGRLGGMSVEELEEELVGAEWQRQVVKYRRSPEAAAIKTWARRRKAAVRAELRLRQRGAT